MPHATWSGLRIDADLMRIARDRAEVMAANDMLSHTEPDGQNVFDRIRDAGLTWYGAGEIIAWNTYPVEYSAPEAIRAWMESPGHKAIMVSTNYNYIGYGAAVSASGKMYYAGVFVKQPDETGAKAKFRSPVKRVLDAKRTRVTIRWYGRRHQAPGPHIGPALLPDPAASCRWRVGDPPHHDRDTCDRRLDSRRELRSPGPGP